MNTEIKKYPIEDSIGFSSRRGVKVLSNMDCSCPLYYKGVEYNSVEQLFHVLKYQKVAELAMKCKNGKEVKRLNALYMEDRDFRWDTNDERKRKRQQYYQDLYDLLHICHQVKYQYNEEFRKVILESGDKFLVEDCHWLDGTRTRGELYGTRRDEKNGVFVGRNICGQSLMELRNEVKENNMKENSNKPQKGGKKRVADILVSGQDRAEHDFYATPPEAVKYLLNVEKFDTDIWECASGQNHLADVLKEYGYDVRTTDIVKRTPTTEKMDFLNCKDTTWDGDIITNPPFKLATDFVKKGLSLVGEGHKVAMFLRLQFLDTLGRYNQLFKDNPPKKIYIITRRISCAKNGDFSLCKSGVVSYAWLVWEKGYQGKAETDWINHDEELDENRMRATPKVAKKTENKATRTRIICFWNQSVTETSYLMRSLNPGTEANHRAIEIGIAEDKFASTIPTINQSASINGLQTAMCQTLTVPISAVGWHVGIYEMPQCTARGTPIR